MRRLPTSILVLFALALACICNYTNRGGMPITVSAPTFIPEVPASTVLPIPTETEAPTQAEETPAPTLAKLGETAEGGGVSLTALQVIDPATPMENYNLEDGMKLVAIEVVITNVSVADPVHVDAYSFFVRDSEGNSQVADLFGLAELIATVELGTGEKVQGWTAFTMPLSASPVSITFDPDIFVLDDYLVGVGITP